LNRRTKKVIKQRLRGSTTSRFSLYLVPDVRNPTKVQVIFKRKIGNPESYLCDLKKVCKVLYPSLELRSCKVEIIQGVAGN